MYLHLVEIDYLDPLTMGVSTLRFSSGDGGYCTRPSDTPANTFYEPRMKIPNNYQVGVFSDGVKGGSAQGGFGTAQFINADGYFDQFSNKCFDGQKVRLLYGKSTGAYSSFAVLLTGTMTRPEYTWQYFNIKTRDYAQLFNRAASQMVYMGNNSGYIGIEGSPDSLMNQTKPLCFGKCLNVPLTLVSEVNSIYQGHNGLIHAVDAVYSDGVLLAFDTDPLFASVASMGGIGWNEAAPTAYEIFLRSLPAAGKYITYLPLGLIRITGVASSTLTADLRGDASGPDGYTDTIPGIVKLLTANYCRRPRTNHCLQSENLTDASWVKTSLTIGAVASTAPISGMTARIATGSSGSLKKVHAIDTSMITYGQFVRASECIGVQLKIEMTDYPENNVLANFNLYTGELVGVETNGYALGPQYTTSKFITTGGIVSYPDNWYFIWVTGQPNAVFSSITTTLILDGALSSPSAGTPGVSLIIGAAQIEKYSSPSMYPGATTTAPVTTYDPLLPPTINEDSFSALSGLTQSVGYYVSPGGTDTVGSIMESLCDSLSCYTAHNRLGELVIGRMTKPLVTDVPKAVFTATEILRDEIESVIPYSSSDGTAAYRVVMQVVKNWTTQSNDSVATSLWDSAAGRNRMAWIEKEFREIRAEDATVLARHPLACEIQVTSLLNSQVDAIAECRRMLQFYSGELSRYTFTVKLEFVTDLNVGDIVSISIDRFGLDSGKNFVLISITETHENGRVRLEVLG